MQGLQLGWTHASKQPSCLLEFLKGILSSCLDGRGGGWIEVGPEILSVDGPVLGEFRYFLQSTHEITKRVYFIYTVGRKLKTLLSRIKNCINFSRVRGRWC